MCLLCCYIEFHKWISIKTFSAEAKKENNWIEKVQYSRSAFVAGGFLVAQFVLIDLEPNHCPFIAVIALSASCK